VPDEPCTGRPCAGTGCSHERAFTNLVAHDQAAGLYTDGSSPAQRPPGSYTERLVPAPLNAAERQFLGFALDLAADQMASRGDEFTPDDDAALENLRRLAAEAQPATTTAPAVSGDLREQIAEAIARHDYEIGLASNETPRSHHISQADAVMPLMHGTPVVQVPVNGPEEAFAFARDLQRRVHEGDMDDLLRPAEREGGDAR